MIVVDGSASTGRTALDTTDWARWTADLAGADRVAVVAFGAHARRIGDVVRAADEPPWSAAGGGRLGVDPAGSDVAAALRLAAAELVAAGEEVADCDVLLATDGRSTSDTGELQRAAAALRSAGCRRLEVRGSAGSDFEPLVRRVTGPGAVAPGAPFRIEVAGVGRGRVDIELLRDDALEVRRAVAADGEFRVRFDRMEAEPGEVTFTARVRGSGLPDGAARARAHVVVADAAAPLFVGDRAPPWDDVAARATEAFDADPEGALAAHDVVWMDGPRDGALRSATLDALRRHAARGGAVVWFGGPDAFHAGGWAGRPLEDLVPLRCRPPDDAGLFLYLALDASGSMARPWGRDDDASRSRDAIVRAAAAGLVESAATETTLVLRRFDDDLAPPGARAEPVRLDDEGRRHVLRELAADSAPRGGTSLVPPLREAYELVVARPERRRLVLVLTDGRVSDAPDDLRRAVTRLAASGADLVVLTPGPDAPGPRLTDALASAGLAARAVPEADELAATFREAEVRSRSSDEDLVDVAARVPDGVPAAFAGLVGLPDVERAARTHAEPQAVTVLRAPDGAPLAAFARRGLGGVAALATSPGRTGWWGAGANVRALVDALGAAAARPGSGRPVRVARDADGRLLVRAAAGVAPRRVAWPGGEADLEPSGDGLWSTPEAALPDDVVRVDVLDGAGARLSTHGLDMPVADEFRRPAPLDVDDLVTRATADAAPVAGGSRTWLAGLAVLLLLVAAAANRGQVGSAPTR